MENKQNKIDREEARDHFQILEEALCKFSAIGGNLHVLTDDLNTDDETINSLDQEWLPQQKANTPSAQWAIERAILDLFMQFNEHDRDYILTGCDV